MTSSYPVVGERDERPTKLYIEQLIMRAGGTIDKVPYYATAVVTSTTEPGQSIGASVGGQWGAFQSRVAREMRYMRREFADEVRGDVRNVNFPDNWVVRVPSTGPDKMMQAISNIFVGDPALRAEMPSGARGGNEAEHAHVQNIITRFLNNLSESEERMGEQSPLAQIKMNAVPHGLSVRSLTVDHAWLRQWEKTPDRDQGESEQDYAMRCDVWNSERRHTSPFKPGSIAPLNIVYDRAERPMTWCVIRDPIDPWDAKQQYPAWTGGVYIREPQPGVAYLCRTRFWSKHWTACYIDGKPALGPDDGSPDGDGIAENPYGLIPVWPAAGGHGGQDPAARPEWELRGALADHLDLLLEDAWCENLEQIYLKRLTYGPKIAVSGITDETEKADVEAELTSGPDHVAFLPSAENRPFPLPAEPIPPWLVARRERLDDRIDRALGYDVRSGAGTPSESGARTRIRLTQSEKQYNDAVLHIQQAEEAYYTAVLRIAKYVLRCPLDVNMATAGEPAQWETLTPEMIPANIKVVCLLTGESEEDKARKQELLMARLTSDPPTINLKGFLSEIGVKDPDGVIAAISGDRIYFAAVEPLMIKIMQEGATAIVVQALAATGVYNTPEELWAAYTALLQQLVPAGHQMPGGTVGGPPLEGDPELVGAGRRNGLEVTPNGAALGGTPYQNAESGISDNPQLMRPGSPEASRQTNRLQQRIRRGRYGSEGP